MSIPAERYDIIIQKRAKYYAEFQQVQDDGTPIPLTGKTLKAAVKESLKSTVIIHNLTEANGGMIKVDANQGVFAMFIPASDTDVPYQFAIYDIKLIDDAYPDIEDERIIEGRVTYTDGVTQ